VYALRGIRRQEDRGRLGSGEEGRLGAARRQNDLPEVPEVMREPFRSLQDASLIIMACEAQCSIEDLGPLLGAFSYLHGRFMAELQAERDLNAVRYPYAEKLVPSGRLAL
jgi:hypothetical protein